MRGSLVTYRQSETHHLEKHCAPQASLKEMCLFFFISTKMSQSPNAWNLQTESEIWISAANNRPTAPRDVPSSLQIFPNQFHCRLRRMVYSLIARGAHDHKTSAVFDTGRTCRSAAVCA
jgi:hypothetical protein